MKPEDLELREKALAASMHGQHIYTCWRDDNNFKANEAWQRAASPEAILSLLERLEKAEKDAERCKSFIVEMCDETFDTWTNGYRMQQTAMNIKAAILAKLANAELPEPESFEAWNAKQHGDPEEIGFLQALRIAYCSGQDSANARQAYAQGAAAQLSAEPAGYQYQSRTGEWCNFMNEKHLADTRADGSWPIRAIYTRKEAK